MSQSKVKIPAPKKGSLTKYGYKLAKPVEERDVALKKIAKAYGKTDAIRKLNVIATYNKNVRPQLTRKIKKDMQFIREL